MPKNVEKVRLGDREIILVGTAHVSNESVELVRKVIEKEKPDTVAVELCRRRYDALRNKKKWKNTEITKVIKDGNSSLFLVNVLLASFQRKIGDELKITPGSEMIEAVKVARKNRMKILLADRDIQVTLKRAWTLMSLKEKATLFAGTLAGFFAGEKITKEEIEKLKEKDILSSVMEDLAEQAPNAKKVLVDERDEYMAEGLINAKSKKIVAVVGAGHLEGIKERLKKSTLNYSFELPENTAISELNRIPKKRSVIRPISYLIPAVFLAVIIMGFSNAGSEVTLNMLKKWFLINGTLAAIGVIFALGHPFSVISAFLAAPFTSLNPALAAGWFAGLAEAKIRTPKVKDFEKLSRISGIRDLWRNNVTRILLVVAFANVGSSIGTFIALPYLATLI